MSTQEAKDLALITEMSVNERRINTIVLDLIDRLDREVAYLEKQADQIVRDVDALSVTLDLLLGDDESPSKPAPKAKS